jgi:hypothetical protein
MALQTLIRTTLPPLIPGEEVPVFQPHLTLTSELARDAGEEVFAGIEVVPSPTVRFREVVVG